MEPNDTELALDDIIHVDIYHTTLKDLYDKLMTHACVLFHKSTNEAWEIPAEHVEMAGHVLGVLNDFQEKLVAPLLTDPALDPYSMPTVLDSPLHDRTHGHA